MRSVRPYLWFLDWRVSLLLTPALTCSLYVVTYFNLAYSMSKLDDYQPTGDYARPFEDDRRRMYPNI